MDSERTMGDLPKSTVDRRLMMLETEVKQLKDKLDLFENSKNENTDLILEDETPLPLEAVNQLSKVDSTSVKRAKRKKKKKTKRVGTIGNDAANWGNTVMRRDIFTKIVVGLIPIAFMVSLALGQGALLPKKDDENTKMTIREHLKMIMSDSTRDAVQTPSSLRKHSRLKATDHERLLQSNTQPPLDISPTTIPSTSSSDLHQTIDSSRPSIIPSTTPPPISLSSSSLFTKRCPIANNDVCGCEILVQSDYRGTMNTSEEGATCARWDSEWITAAFGSYLPQAFPNSGLIDNYCRNPGGIRDRVGCISGIVSADGDYEHFCNVPMCDPCECVPPCGQPNLAACGCPSFLQAEQCCNEDEASCKCGYLREACSKSLESGSDDFCDLAEEVCCEDSKNPDCGCNMLEQICSENPNQSTCDFAARSCCPVISELHLDFDWGAEEVCKCEFHTYVTDVLGFESDSQFEHCANAGLIQSQLENRRSLERGKLKNLYTDTNGEYWFNNEGWNDETDLDHCNWYGVKCNDQNYVTEMNLRKNNLTGASCWACRIDFEDLLWLDLAQNQISLKKSSRLLYNRKLEHIDISENVLTGHADMLLFPAARLVNFSHNKFTSAGFKRFYAAYDTIQVVDLSDNLIAQDASEIFLNIPPTLENLDLSNNDIGGFIQEKFPIEGMIFFAMANTSISGPLPDFPNTSPKLRYLDVSANELTGTIPSDIFKLVDLSVLNVGNNNLSRNIPSSIGDLSQLKILNLSSNLFSQSIPIKLAKLKDVMETLDLSSNALTGLIPSELGRFQGEILLSENSDLINPAPLDLCFLEGFDGINDTSMCPLERNALKQLYESAKGREWTNSESWLDAYKSHCMWYGVVCNEENVTVKLDLSNNGLSGTMSEDIAVLRSIGYLDLSDNHLKGSIPTEIGLLSKLSYLRLSYNTLVGKMPKEFQELSQLQLIQLNSNRLSGEIPLSLDAKLQVGQSSFISDCGVPTMYENVMLCENCTMCCNSQDDCFPTDKTEIQKAGFDNYLAFSWVFFLCIIGGCCVLNLASFMYAEYQKRGGRAGRMDPSEISRDNIDKDKKYALNTIGQDSVYMFFLGNSWWGWGFALATMAAQIGILFVFVQGAEFDLSDDISDLVYTWKCPRDQELCRDTIDVSWRGWVCFGILMIAHLLKDIINGSKMIVLSAKPRHSMKTRIRFFFGGTFLMVTSLFALFVTTVYNEAIATSNTALIENSVIVLFITDLDEMFYRALRAINPQWVSNEGRKQTQQQSGDADTLKVLTTENEELKDGIEQIRIEMEKLRGVVERMQEQTGREETPVVSAQYEDNDKGVNLANIQDEGPSDKVANLPTSIDAQEDWG